MGCKGRRIAATSGCTCFKNVTEITPGFLSFLFISYSFIDIKDFFMLTTSCFLLTLRTACLTLTCNVGWLIVTWSQVMKAAHEHICILNSHFHVNVSISSLPLKNGFISNCHIERRTSTIPNFPTSCYPVGQSSTWVLSLLLTKSSRWNSPLSHMTILLLNQSAHF